MLAEGDGPQAAVLVAHGLTARQWDEVSTTWTRRIAVEAMGDGEARLADIYVAAFTREQDTLKSIPEMSADQWAATVVEVSTGGAAALRARGLTEPDYLRLSRRWASALSADRALAKRYFTAFYALSPKREPRSPA